MKELVIISGKGGTGKTSLTGSLATLAHNPVLADCDVDAADLHLLLSPKIQETHAFYSGHEAIIQTERCVACGRCKELCRFDAVDEINEHFIIDPAACEGCGVCVQACPAEAIAFPDSLCGHWYRSKTRCGPMVHARLGTAAENSGKLVSVVRQQARQIASAMPAEWILIDGPPGTGCPVIASITGADALLVITEPTLSGQHDLLRVLSLARHFKLPAFVCVNKWDINPEIATSIETATREVHATVLPRIPYDPSITQAQINGLSAVEFNDGPASQSIKKLWETLCLHLQ